MLNYLLLAVLVISLVTDIRERKILNIVTLPAIAAGLLYHTFSAGWQGVLLSGTGLLLGGGLFLIPYLLGGIGAGDVKLLAAIGALKGAEFVFSSFLYTCLAGGAIALLILMKQRNLTASMHRIAHALLFFRKNGESFAVLDKTELHNAFPYGVAIVAGTVSALIWGGIS
jgi:prepilin peptidase CpaA